MKLSDKEFLDLSPYELYEHAFRAGTALYVVTQNSEATGEAYDRYVAALENLKQSIISISPERQAQKDE